jgi:hypothetical protein
MSRNCAQSKNISIRDRQMQGNDRKVCKRKYQVTNTKGRVVQVKKLVTKLKIECGKSKNLKKEKEEKERNKEGGRDLVTRF